MEYRNIKDLKPHPVNGTIYGDIQQEKSQQMTDLVDSVKAEGIKTPIQITPDNIILAGHRRLEAAIRAGLDRVPVEVRNITDSDEQVIHIIHSNRGHRDIDGLQVAYSIRALNDAYSNRNRKRGEQGKRNDILHTPKTTSLSRESEVVQKRRNEKPSETLASEVGVSPVTAFRSVSVLEAAEKLENSGRDLEAKELKQVLKKSARGAYEFAQKRGLIETAKTDQQPRPTAKETIANQEHYTLAQFEALSVDEQIRVLNTENNKGKFNEQKNADIEWAHWSWNPITGCKHNCPYCYARDIAEDLYPTKFEPTIWANRLTAPYNMTVPKEAETDIGYKNVFTCSMADLFGRWVPTEWIERVLDTVADNPQWNFLFLTKFPIRMAEFEFPDNAWVGTSVDYQIRVKPVEAAFSKVRAKVKWLSCEPMIEPLKFTSLDMFSWVVIGGASKSTQTPEWIPPRDWVHDLEVQAYQAGCMVYEKTNLQPIERLIEFPGQPAKSQRKAPVELRYLPEVEQP